MDNSRNAPISESRLPVIFVPSSPYRTVRRWRIRAFPLVVLASLAAMLAVILLSNYTRAPTIIMTFLLPDHGNRAADLNSVRANTTPAVKFSTVIPRDLCDVESHGPQLLVDQKPIVLPLDRSIALGSAVERTSDNANLIVCGFASSSVFSVGQSVGQNTWMILASDIKDAVFMPPLGFVGSMDLSLLLVLANGSLAGGQFLRLEWRRPTSEQAIVANVDTCLARGVALAERGDHVGARLLFRWAAEQHNSRAALLLAETYDPAVSEKVRLPDADYDVAAARIWYKRAADLGSVTAAQRLRRLANW
jgi:hypothetical protein